MYTQFFSSHPFSTKRGIIISLFCRAHRICDENYIADEIKHIRSSFLKLQYPLHVINQARWTAKYRFHNPITRPARTASYHLSLPYHPSLLPLRPALANIGVSTSFSSRNTLRTQLSHTGPKPLKDAHVPGVYKVECKQCPDVYFGETGHNIGLRRTEHKTGIKKKKTANAIFVHQEMKPGHEFLFERYEFIIQIKPNLQTPTS